MTGLLTARPESLGNESVPEWTYAQLVRRIVTGEFPAGSRLTEEQLASDLGVSRTPLRAALARLETARLIIKQRNRAIYVAPLRVEEIEELAGIRERIEGFVAYRAAERVKRERLPTDRVRFIATQIDAKGASNAFEVFKLGRDFHAEIVALSGLSRVADVLADVNLGLERYRYILAEDAGRAPKRVREHGAILRAIEDGDAERAEALMREHIRNALQLFLKKVASALAKSP